MFDLHKSFAWFVVIANALAGCWALAAHQWKALRTRALWWFTAVAEVAVFIQVALGVSLIAGQKMQAPKFHMFYGFVGIITVALIYSYRAQMAKHRYLLYGFGGLFLAGLGIRAMLKATTG